jgi:hypothetical protein
VHQTRLIPGQSSAAHKERSEHHKGAELRACDPVLRDFLDAIKIAHATP